MEKQKPNLRKEVRELPPGGLHHHGTQGRMEDMGSPRGVGEGEVREKEGKGREERIKRRKDFGRNYTRDLRSVKVHFCGEEGETSWAPARKNTS